MTIACQKEPPPPGGSGRARIRSLLMLTSALALLVTTVSATAQNLILGDDFRNVFQVQLTNAAAPNQTAAVSAAGNTALAPANTRRFYGIVNVAPGSSTYAHVVVLAGSGRLAGDALELTLNIPNSVNPTIEVRDGTAGGTLLLSFPGLGRTAAFQRNVSFRFNGTAWKGTWPPTPPTTGLESTSDQFSAGSAFGTRGIESNTAALAPTVGQPVYAQNTDGSVKLRSATFGRAIVVQAAQFQFGEVIPPPTEENGTPIVLLGKPKNWPYRLDGSGNPTTTLNTDFYYSADADLVFASSPGQVNVVWETAVSPRVAKPRTYIVSPSPVKTPRTLYWTEQGFKGPKVQVPTGRVDALRFAYNPRFPQSVAGLPGYPYPSPHVAPPSDPANPLPPENRTLWFDSTDQLLHAYNWEGRILVEYLGPPRDATGLRTHLGTEIVDLTREIAPQLIRVKIGEALPPQNNIAVDTEDLTADFIAGLTLEAKPFVFRHYTQNATKSTYYAIRTTTPTVVAGGGEVLSNEVLAYWLEPSLRGIRWPKYYAGYIISWPTDDADFTLYVRPDQAGEPSIDTKVQLDSENNPQLVFQDDPTLQEAKLTMQNEFYTAIGGSDENRALIQYTNGDEIWFERVKSRPNTAFVGFNSVANAVVGARIEPPAAALAQLDRYDDGDGDASDDVFVGYIRVVPTGRDYNPQAYKNPLAVGFEEARKGAIIGVNARPGKDTLEVWWFRRSRPPGSLIKGTYWPSFVQKYQLTWPVNGDEIILASNEGSNDIGLAGTGTIYTQNNSTLPGFNPNEEHALMIGGRAFALRDDLNISTGSSASSAPYVLVNYVETDQRPAMRVFRVLREKNDITFNYPAVAGTPLGLPRPLGDIPLARGADGKTLNVEVPTDPDLPPGVPTEVNLADPYKLYSRFTFIDRKQAHWVYRGRHDGSVGRFVMRYKYPTLPGFYFPDKGNAQPPVGTIVPFLRPLDANGAPIGDSVTGTPLDIVFQPQWPAAAPVLNVGETLTLARAGLPQVRGQSSAEVVYQQASATSIQESLPGGPSKSIRLYDPTIQKSYDLVSQGVVRLVNIPNTVKVSDYLGRKYFPNLPPHLSQRFYYDPNVGAVGSTLDGTSVRGSLVLGGEFRDEIFGADYLLPNVMSDKDVADVKALCHSTDPQKAAWNAAIDGLRARLDTYLERDQLPGTYEIPEGGTEAFGPQQIVEVTRSSTSDMTNKPYKPVGTAVDSYAVAAIDGNEGFVVLAMGNGNGKIQAVGEPVSLQVFRVARPLGTGELKVLTTANPLDEKVTLQHSLDFAGDPSHYEFQFITSPPTSSGSAPALFSIQRQLIVEDGAWRLLNNPPADFAKYRNPGEADEGAGSAFTTVNLPANPVVINLDPSSGTSIDLSRPHALLRKRFTMASGTRPLQLYFSLDLSDLAGAIVYLNGAEIAVHNVPGRGDTGTVTAPGLDFDPLSIVFSVPTNALLAGENSLTVQLYSIAGGAQAVNARLEAAISNYDAAVVPPNWFPVDPNAGDVLGIESLSGKTYVGKSRHIVEGSSPQTLSDNYFSMRYREVGPVNDDTGWSTWSSPQLVEGWIKRVLAGINPFNQRVTDLLNNPVNTDVSLLTQAGTRWEGDIALTLSNINNVGLIEIYETVLRRGQLLSINGAPRINNPAVNDALLLAAGYLSDLYTILGNEAFADAANPTIATGTDGTFGDVTTSLFAFKGQLATVLDEELALLRGRDDFLAPGSKTAPIYNRLVWNYTKGILSGEAIYAVNYNISDADKNGTVDAKDAARQYPQGHGDAYGHYLTALTGYYSLLTNDFFSWQPRSEAVLVLGQPVAVDYFDERKMAGAAANVVRTGAQIVDLTYRQAFTAAENAGWQNLRDLNNGQPVTNAQTLITRSWGVDDWACRSGQGAFLHWVTANSGLADVDPNPAHEGIQKVDRTTVPELSEIIAQGKSIQKTLDNADARLNPLGLSRGVLSFDISPGEIDAGKTHYEQIQQRAISALQNSVDAFNNAKNSTQFLRKQEDSLTDLRAAIDEEERAFEQRLIEIYGTPYPDDIGPGKTYVQGYEGPDLVHSLYFERLEKFTFGEDLEGNAVDTRRFTVPTSMILDADSRLYIPLAQVEIVVDTNGLPVKPEEFVGRRAHPGRMQSGTSGYFTARIQLTQAIREYESAIDDLTDSIDLVSATIDTHNDIDVLKRDYGISSGALTALSRGLGTAKDYFVMQGVTQMQLGDIAADSFPKVLGLANDTTFAGRVSLRLAGLAAKEGFDAIAAGFKGGQVAVEGTIAVLQAVLNTKVADLNWSLEQKQQVYGLQVKIRTVLSKQSAIDAAIRALDDAGRQLQATSAEGNQVLKERAIFRQRSAAIVQGYRTRDLAFRAFRNEALEKYKTLFDLSARYAFLAARAYDFETGLLDYTGNSKATAFFDQIVRSRAPGVLTNGRPQFGGSATGDPGLAGVLAQLDGDWSVVKTRLGFNNPDRYRTTFSLRTELFRILRSAEGDAAWKETLNAHYVDNILDDPDVRRYCAQAGDANGLPVPGLVFDFPSTITNGFNFFGRPLAGGDHGFSQTAFATKIRAAGIAFPGYVGMDSPTSIGGVLGSIGATTPDTPNPDFTDPDALSATPYIYLVPAGADSLRAPPLGDSSAVRTWQVEDQAIPLPFDIGGTDFATRRTFVSSDSLSEPPFAIRKHQAFRAVPGDTVFKTDAGFTNARLIGRSVWNSRWKLVIPGHTLLNDPKKGLDTFSRTVKDVLIHLESYSYSGN